MDCVHVFSALFVLMNNKGSLWPFRVEGATVYYDDYA